MDYGSVFTYESSSFSFSGWVYTIKSLKSFMVRLAKQCDMFVQHKVFWLNNHLVKIINSKAFTRAFFRGDIQLSIERMLFPVWGQSVVLKRLFRVVFRTENFLASLPQCPALPLRTLARHPC